MLLPGCARLVTRPAPTGSPTFSITIGIVVVAFLAAKDACVTTATITSTWSRTNSAARSGNRENCPSADRYSMRTFWPSMYPSARRPSRKASTPNPRDVGANRPMRYNLVVGFCASAASGAARRPPAKLPRNMRRSIQSSAWPPAGRGAEESGQGVDPTVDAFRVSALGLPAALALAVVRDLHLELCE